MGWTVINRAATLLSWAFRSLVYKLHLPEGPSCGLEGSLATGTSADVVIPPPAQWLAG